MAAIAICLLLCGATLEGKVVGVHDGDSITVLDSAKAQYKIRLASIDAPELGQPFGTKAREHLAGLIHGKQVRVETTGTDKYSRTLGIVYVGGSDINRQMIADGFAWQYIKYNTSADYRDAQVTAAAAKRGLWTDDKPVEPWEWRKTEKERRKAHRKISSDRYFVPISVTYGFASAASLRVLTSAASGSDPYGNYSPLDFKPCEASSLRSWNSRAFRTIHEAIHGLLRFDAT